MTAMTSVSPVGDSLTKHQCGFDGAMYAPEMLDLSKWNVGTATGGFATSIVHVEYVIGATVAVVYFGQPAKPNTSYSVFCTALDASKQALTTNNVAFTTTNRTKSLLKDGEEFYRGMLDAITHGFGQTCQGQRGVPTTRLIKDWSPGDTILVLESTIGLPREGYLFVGDHAFYYTGKYPQILVNVVPIVSRQYNDRAPFLSKFVHTEKSLYRAIPAKTEVRFDVAAHLSD